MVLRVRFGEAIRLVEERADPKPARRTGHQACQRSGVCCWTRPCELHPGDEMRLAAHLLLSPSDLFQTYLVVDEFDHGLALLPRRRTQDAGRYLTASETYDADSPCVFHDETTHLCRVHDAKPTGGAQFTCSMTPAEVAALPRPAWSVEALVALGWSGDRDDA